MQTKQTIARMLPTLRAMTEFAEFKCKAQQSLMNEKKRKKVKIIIKYRWRESASKVGEPK